MSKFLIVVYVFILLLTSCSYLETDSIDDQTSVLENGDLTGDYIYWYGRHHMMDNQVYYYHTSTGFKISFYGRVVDIKLKLTNKQNDIYYTLLKDTVNYYVDDTIIQSKAEETVRVIFDTYDYHTVELIKRSEPEDGITSLLSVTTNGYFLKVEKPDETNHFLIIGASGISGHGALGQPNEGRTTKNSSSIHSFGFISANHFGGTFEFVSSSGWGLVYGFNDKTGVENIMKAYDNVGIAPNRKVIEIQYKQQITPKYIIINIGGNDYSSVINNLGGFDKQHATDAFKLGVFNFLSKLRTDAPDAHIIWTMTPGSLNGNAAKQVVSQMDDVDQQFIHVVEIKDVDYNQNPTGANNHASYLTHTLSAESIIDKISQIMQN